MTFIQTYIETAKICLSYLWRHPQADKAGWKDNLSDWINITEKKCWNKITKLEIKTSLYTTKPYLQNLILCVFIAVEK